MTVASIFRNFWTSSENPQTTTQAFNYFSDRSSGSHDYYHYGSHKKTKGKSKSDKKHAILSALTLLAFLFFLNILQNCIREQNLKTRGSVMMFGSTSPTGPQVKDTDEPTPEKSVKRKRSAEKFSFDTKINKKEVTEPSRKSRVLLGLYHKSGESLNRQEKFIRNYTEINNWTKELTQISEKDLEDQKLKTLNFPLYLKNNKFSYQTSQLLRPESSLKNFSPKSVEASSKPFVFKRIKKTERTGFTSNTPLNGIIAFQNESVQNPVFLKSQNQTNFVQDQVQNKKTSMSSAYENSGQWVGFSQTTKAPKGSFLFPKQTIRGSFAEAATTPRNMRSEYSTTIRSEYDEYDRYHEESRDDYQSSTIPTLGLDLNTFQTYPVRYYYNHRQNVHGFKENETGEAIEFPFRHEITEIDRKHNEESEAGSETSLFYPTNSPVSHPKNSHLNRTKYKIQRPEHLGHYLSKSPYAPEFRYRYSPYRKTTPYESTQFHDPLHDDYHIVVARYPQGEEPGFDFPKFLWSVFTSFARPLTKLVPGLAKDTDDEPQCYDLLVCEAQRVSKFMGPTAEALTMALGTLFSWAVTEETRQIMIDALNAGRENTCQQQIKDCEQRSGGKSAMTVIAQVMEIKLR